MHELPVVLDIIGSMDEESLSKGFTKIESIDIVIGELSSVVSECVQMYFDSMSEGHTCSGAKLNFTHNPAMFRCSACGKEFPHEKDFICPFCGGDGVLIKGTGRDFYIRSFEGGN